MQRAHLVKLHVCVCPDFLGFTDKLLFLNRSLWVCVISIAVAVNTAIALPTPVEKSAQKQIEEDMIDLFHEQLKKLENNATESTNETVDEDLEQRRKRQADSFDNKELVSHHDNQDEIHSRINEPKLADKQRLDEDYYNSKLLEETQRMEIPDKNMGRINAEVGDASLNPESMKKYEEQELELDTMGRILKNKERIKTDELDSFERRVLHRTPSYDDYDYDEEEIPNSKERKRRDLDKKDLCPEDEIEVQIFKTKKKD